MDTSFRNLYRIFLITTSFLLLLLVAWTVRRQLVWIGTAAFLAIALNPAVEWFRRATKFQRGPAIGLTFASLVAFLVIVVASLVPPVVHQSQGLISHLPSYTDSLINSQNIVGRSIRKYDLVARIKSDQVQLVRQLTSFGGSFFTVIRSIFSSLAATVTVLGLTFFMLLEGPDWLSQLWLRYRSSNKARYQKLVHEMYRSVTGYVNGNVLTSVIAGVAVAIVLLIMGISYAAPLAIFIGIMDLVPLVGATLGSIVVIIVALFHSLTAAIVMLIFFVVYQQTENHVLQPLVYGKTVRISPLLVLIAVLIGAGLGGLLGALVAIPAAASLQIVVKDYLSHRHQGQV